MRWCVFLQCHSPGRSHWTFFEDFGQMFVNLTPPDVFLVRTQMVCYTEPSRKASLFAMKTHLLKSRHILQKYLASDWMNHPSIIVYHGLLLTSFSLSSRLNHALSCLIGRLSVRTAERITFDLSLVKWIIADIKSRSCESSLSCKVRCLLL